MKFTTLLPFFKREFSQEIEQWVEKEWISEKQASEIRGFYQLPAYETNHSLLGYRVLMSLGIALVLLAIITLITAYWAWIPRGVRVVSASCLTIGLHVLAWKFYRKGEKRYALNLFFLGLLLYGATLLLVGRVYHLEKYFSWGVYLWAWGSFLVGFLVRSSWLTSFGMVLGVFWILLAGRGDWGYLLFPFFLATSLWILIYTTVNPWLFISFLLGMGAWIQSLLFQVSLNWGSESLLVYVGLFLLGQALSQWMIQVSSLKVQTYGYLLSLWTLRLGTILLLILSFSFSWSWLLKTSWTHLLIPLAFLGCICLISGWISWRKQFLLQFLGTAFLALIPFGFIWIRKVLFVDVSWLNEIFFQMLYNGFAVFVGVLWVLKGMGREQSHYYYTGIGCILCIAVFRYLELSGGYFSNGVFFLVCAVLIIGAAKYWKSQHQ